jgi:glycosyltransferase involved in cell wall biosynthesis
MPQGQPTTLATHYLPFTSVFPFRRKLTPLADRDPLRVMFIVTDMPVGGAEILLTEIIRRIDRSRFAPELCCLKRFDRLGEALAREIPAFTGLITQKYDVTVLWRLVRLLRRRRIDAVVTVGAGDKMFWGRLAARLAGVPVVCSALHSTGWPEHVEFSNRLLSPLTDAFIAVAEPQGCYLAESEGCPAHKIRVIPNGVDVDRFCPREPNRRLQEELKLDPQSPVVGIVAALRPEKNHEMFLRTAEFVHHQLPTVQFLIVGDGPERGKLESLAQRLDLANTVRFLGTRSDVSEILSLIDVVLLTSHTEANPICLMEAMASGKPIVATRVGSIAEIVSPGLSGYLVSPNNSHNMANCVIELLGDRDRAIAMGRVGRERVVAQWSVSRMVQGYENLLAGIYSEKAGVVAKPVFKMTEVKA